MAPKHPRAAASLAVRERRVRRRRVSAPTPQSDVAHIPGGDVPLVGNRMRALVRNVLEVVPWRDAIDVITEYAREVDRSEVTLDVLALRGEQAKPLIERRSGTALGTEEAGGLLGKSAETVRNWIEQGKLVGYHAVGDRTRIRLPVWQFRSDQGVHAWVQPLISAFGANGWNLVDFVTVPRATLGGVSYLNWLTNGRDAEVIALARRSNPD